MLERDEREMLPVGLFGAKGDVLSVITNDVFYVPLHVFKLKIMLSI